MKKRRRTMWLALLLTATFVAALGLVTRSKPTTSLCMSLAVPAYFRPGANWDRSIAGSPAPRYLVMNPASGPGDAPEPSYDTTVRKAQRAGAKVLGYVHTDYGRRSPELVEAEIGRYRQWYDVDGIFFDEVTSQRDGLAYYESLAAYVRAVAADSVVALNPGTYPDPSYARVADILVTFEGNYEFYRELHPPQWVEAYPASRFWHLVHTTDASQMPSALSLARNRRAGSVYITDGTLDNPWSTLPSYWSAETRAVAATPVRCP